MLIRWYNLPALWRNAGPGERLMTLAPPALLPLLLLAGGEASIWAVGLVVLVCALSALLKTVIGFVRFVVLPRRSARLVLWRLPLAVVGIAATVALALGSYQSVREDAAAELRDWQAEVQSGQDVSWPCREDDACPREAGWPIARFKVHRSRRACGASMSHQIQTRLGPDIWTHFHLKPDGTALVWDQRDNVRTYLDVRTLEPLGGNPPESPSC